MARVELGFQTLKNYIEFVDQHVCKWLDLVVNMKKHLLIIRELCEQLRLILNFRDESEPLLQLPMMNKRLHQKLHLLIENEMCSTNDIMDQLTAAHSEVESRYATLLPVLEHPVLIPSQLGSRQLALYSTLIAYVQEFNRTYVMSYIKLRDSYKMIDSHDEESVALCLKMLNTETKACENREQTQYFLQYLEQI